MAFQTTDVNFLNDWLTVGPLTRYQKARLAAPRTTQLLGNTVTLWCDPEGQVHASADGKALRVQVQYGYVWVCPSGQPARALFSFPEYAEAGRRIVDCDGFGVAVSGLRMVENFLDMGHFPFVHSSYLGEVPHTEVAPYKVDIHPETDEIWATDCSFYQPRTSGSATTGVQAKYVYRVMQPMSAMLYKSCFGRTDALDAIGLFVQPVSDESIIAYVLMAYFDDVTSDTELIAFQHTIFGQDKPILENQVPKRMPLQLGREMPARCDSTSITYRRWLKARNVTFGAIPN